MTSGSHQDTLESYNVQQVGGRQLSIRSMTIEGNNRPAANTELWRDPHLTVHEDLVNAFPLDVEGEG